MLNSIPDHRLAVAPKGAETELILYLPDDTWAHYQGVIGKSQAITLNVTDLQVVFEELISKRVKFAQEPDAQLWGTFATLEDSEGNHILLVEQPKG